MNKTMSLIVSIAVTPDILKHLVQQAAQDLKLQGTARVVDPSTLRIVVYGDAEKIDDFIDALYEGYKKVRPEYIEVEPAIKEQDFRGVFRVIE